MNMRRTEFKVCVRKDETKSWKLRSKRSSKKKMARLLVYLMKGFTVDRRTTYSIRYRTVIDPKSMSGANLYPWTGQLLSVLSTVIANKQVPWWNIASLPLRWRIDDEKVINQEFASLSWHELVEKSKKHDLCGTCINQNYNNIENSSSS